MSEKASEDVAFENKTPPEYNATEPTKRESIVDAGARRASVALNIVENPLQVSFAVNGSSPLPIANGG